MNKELCRGEEENHIKLAHTEEVTEGTGIFKKFHHLQNLFSFTNLQSGSFHWTESPLLTLPPKNVPWRDTDTQALDKS